MAITSAICNSFKQEILQGYHSFNASGDTPAGNAFKLALYTSSATINKSTTAYSATNEISNTSGSAYSAGGIALTNFAVCMYGSPLLTAVIISLSPDRKA